MQEIVLTHHKLVYTTAKRYAAAVPHKHDDIISAGNLGLVIGAQAVADGKCKYDDPVPFLISRIKFAILRFLRHDHLIRIPETSFAREHIEAPVMHEYNEHIIGRTFMPIGQIIKDIPLTDIQRQVMKLMVEEYTQAEISTKIGLSLGTVKHIIKDVRRITNEYLS